MNIKEMMAFVGRENMNPTMISALDKAVRGEYNMTNEETDVFRILIGIEPITESMKGLSKEDLFNKNRRKESQSYWAQVRREEYLDNHDYHDYREQYY